MNYSNEWKLGVYPVFNFSYSRLEYLYVRISFHYKLDSKPKHLTKYFNPEVFYFMEKHKTPPYSLHCTTNSY